MRKSKVSNICAHRLVTSCYFQALTTSAVRYTLPQVLCQSALTAAADWWDLALTTALQWVVGCHLKYWPPFSIQKQTSIRDSLTKNQIFQIPPRPLHCPKIIFPFVKFVDAISKLGSCTCPVHVYVNAYLGYTGYLLVSIYLIPRKVQEFHVTGPSLWVAVTSNQNLCAFPPPRSTPFPPPPSFGSQ